MYHRVRISELIVDRKEVAKQTLGNWVSAYKLDGALLASEEEQVSSEPPLLIHFKIGSNPRKPSNQGRYPRLGLLSRLHR